MPRLDDAVVLKNRGATEADCVQEHRPALLAFLRRKVGSGMAEDLCHECFLIAIRSLRTGALKDPTRLDAFLWATARRLAVTSRRDPFGRAELLDMDGVASPGATPLDGVEQSEIRTLVWEALNRLATARDREILERRYLRDEEPITIQRDLDLSSGGFKVALHRARRRLRSILAVSETHEAKRAV